MSPSKAVSRLVIRGFLLLLLFTLVVTALAERNLWPQLPAGAFHDTDLWAGLAAGVALLILLARTWRSRSRPKSIR